MSAEQFQGILTGLIEKLEITGGLQRVGEYFLNDIINYGRVIHSSLVRQKILKNVTMEEVKQFYDVSALVKTNI